MKTRFHYQLHYYCLDQHIMDNLMYKFDQATDLELDQNAPKFSALYKNNEKLIKKQQQRRNEILSNRLSKRDKLFASIRRLVADVASDEDDHDAMSTSFGSSTNSNINDNNNNGNTSTNLLDRTRIDDGGGGHSTLAETSSCSSINNVFKCKVTQVEDRKFRNKAMLSEWLVDRPMNFEYEWVLKATPVGKRCLVFARKGETVAYSRTGQFIKAFQSSLPGGCHMHISHCRRQFAIVDCIYVQQNNSFYLMDALAWNEHKLYESEASFRFFWMQSRYNEAQDKFLTLSSKNESRFYCLNTYSATDRNILTALNNDHLIKEHNLQLDGILFFHMQGPYVPGANPLVLWIKPEMVDRVLNINN